MIRSRAIWPHRRPNPGPKPGLDWSAFARRYSRNRFCFLFLWLLRCFSSPGSLLHPMHSGAGDPEGPGCPIRKSQDHSLVTSFSGLIAGSYVLHRLSTPRHPPYALNHLITPTRSRQPPARCNPLRETLRFFDRRNPAGMLKTSLRTLRSRVLGCHCADTAGKPPHAVADIQS